MTGNDSILHRMTEQGRRAHRVTLKGTERDSDATERYAILGEIARGGTGVVHKGRDNDLGRDVALKVLREDHLGTKEFIERFVEEAQIGGQLQHPGIVPVYELGLRSDQRPYFAMKLVKGETLAARLAARTDAADGRRGLLAVYREVCRTMAYAHARGVIHRDLKPSNVMIGSFGEVQVVDWGFAKVVRKGGVADEKLSEKKERDVTMISTVRSGDGSSHSVAGSVMGTPGYMSPEQAMGRIDDLDEKSDLFGLGAILCEILTGGSPYTGSDTDRMTAAAQARLEPAFERLDECGADERLVTLSKRCLAPLPKDRPASAQVLGDEIAGYLRDAETRAHRAQLRALEAEEQVEAQRRGRRLATHGGLAAAAALLIAAGTWLWIDHDRTQRERERQGSIQIALQDAERLRAAGQWTEALAAVDRARALGDDGALAATIQREAKAAQDEQRRDAEDMALLDRLEEIRGQRGLEVSDAQTDEAFTATITQRWPDFAVDTGRLKRSPYARALAAVFDAWALMRRRAPGLEGRDWQQLDRIARAIDPAHNHVRDALVDDDPSALVELAASEAVLELPPAMKSAIGATLMLEDREEGEQLLDEAQRRHPDDSWIHHQLGMTAEMRRQWPKAVEHFTAALALQPDSIELRHRLGMALSGAGDSEGAVAVWKEGIALKDDWGHGHFHIAMTLGGAAGRTLGRKNEHDEHLRRAIELGVAHGGKLGSLGSLLIGRRRYADAISVFQASLRGELSAEDRPIAHAGLAKALWRDGQREAAEAAIQDARKLAGEHARAWAHIGNFLVDKEDWNSALAAYDRSLQLDEKRPALLATRGPYYAHRGYVLGQLGNSDAALASFAKAIELGDSSFLTHIRYGACLNDDFRRHDDAIEQFELAHERAPRRFEAPWNMAIAWSDKGEWQQSLQWLEKAAGLAPTPRARKDLGSWAYGFGRRLLGDGKPAEASSALRHTIALQPEFTNAHVDLGTALSQLGDWEGAQRKFLDALAIAENHPVAWSNLAHTRMSLGDLSGAIEARSRVVELNPELATNDPVLNHIAALPAAVRDDRSRALQLLRAVLSLQEGFVATRPDQVVGVLFGLQKFPDLAPIRDADDLGEDFRKLWTQLEALKQRAERAANEKR